MIISELPLETASTDAAFISALTPKEFCGHKLEPYSLFRQLVGIEVCGRDSSWMTTVIVHIWLCTQGEPQIYAARRDHDKALKDAVQWAETCGLRRTDSPKMDELIKIFNQIMSEINESTQLMSEENGTEPKNVGGRPG
jgi:hypothetical protein